MKTDLTLAAALMLTTTVASAGGIDRTLTEYASLFEVGNYAELSYAAVQPNVTGTYSAPLVALGGTTSTGVMSQDFSTLSGSMKYDLTPRLALGLFFNQPFGTEAYYPDGANRGLMAEWESNSQAIVMKYQVTPNISVYGGVRSIESQASILIPNQLIAAPIAQAQSDGALQLAQGANQAAAGAQLAADNAALAAAGGDAATAAELGAQALALGAQAQSLGAQAQALGAQAQMTADTISVSTNATTGPFTYRAETEKDRQTSYIVGAAYERPQIALRVALTYEQGYTHSFETVETLAATQLNLTSTTDVEMPDVYTLDFQTGVAKDTLVFGSIRHATWGNWEVRPVGYEALASDNVADFESDVTTYRIGVGRQINDAFSGFARITYEARSDDTPSPLAPVDGSTAFGIGGSYVRDAFRITAGVEYITFGDTTDDTGTVFANNDAVALGLSVGYRF